MVVLIIQNMILGLYMTPGNNWLYHMPFIVLSFPEMMCSSGKLLLIQYGPAVRPECNPVSPEYRSLGPRIGVLLIM